MAIKLVPWSIGMLLITALAHAKPTGSHVDAMIKKLVAYDHDQSHLPDYLMAPGEACAMGMRAEAPQMIANIDDIVRFVGAPPVRQTLSAEERDLYDAVREPLEAYKLGLDRQRALLEQFKQSQAKELVAALRELQVHQSELAEKLIKARQSYCEKKGC